MDAKVLLTKLASLGIVVTIDRDKLSCRPASRLTPELRREVMAHRHELVALLVTGANAGPQAELLLARKLATRWSDSRAKLEQLVLAAAKRKSWPRIQLAPGVWLLPGKQGWQRYAGNPCTQPDGLVRALEVLHGHPAAG